MKKTRDHITIDGKQRLHGEVYINGAKNAALAIIPASVLSNDVCVIENLPDIDDVTSYYKALIKIGAKCDFRDSHTLEVDCSKIDSYTAVCENIKKIRASYYLVGALLGRFGKAEVMMPGGCNLGTRPIDYHVKGFEALGAKVVIENGMIKASADELKGAHIYLDFASVGATVNIMLAAIFAKGVTTIENAAKEPHVVDCANFLNKLGARIKGAGTNVIKITGVKELGGGEYTLIPDQIEAGTYMIAAAATQGDVTVKNIIPVHMDSVSAKLAEMNCEIAEGGDCIRVKGPERLSAVNVKSMVYPGFPTDLQPQMTALLCYAHGTSIITETVFENRFQYINELRRLGCNITVEGRVAVIEGPRQLTGAEVTATDIRAGVALIVAALNANGRTVIGNVKYIDRGYESIVDKLKSLGADIARVRR